MQNQRTTIQKPILLVFLGVLCIPAVIHSFPIPQIPFAPRQYLCNETTTPINIDGILDDTSWVTAPWTEPFIDIEGPDHTPPKYLTQTRMVWDQDYLYVGAFLLEPHIWGTMKKRDSVIYYDNDFEIFIDPDGDNHQYYELEINALGTEWDLRLEKPYRDGGPAIDQWDISGLATSVRHQGTINDPSDVDIMWTVEMAIPWTALAEFTERPSPPLHGDIWRINFSRVQWKVAVKDDHYTKLIDPVTRKHFPECNWVWSPQGLIAMHYPEMWGEVMFTDTNGSGDFSTNKQHIQIITAHQLMPIYYAQKQFFDDNERFASSLDELEFAPPEDVNELVMESSGTRFKVTMKTDTGTYSVDEKGQLLTRDP